MLADYHSRFRYILVDEYQDTNVAQYLWLRLLAQGRQNLCCVGDDDQSIYGWRGAEVDNILRFERDFPGAKVVRLERNYRSTAHILAAASGLIAANKDRLGKTLWTEGEQRPEGEGARGLGRRGREPADRRRDRALDQGQAAAIARCAILVRASFQMRAFEERFVMLQIPYQVIGGPRFFERAEIRDAHAYLRLVQSEDDDLAFERIVNVPKRGIGDTTVQKLLAVARGAGVSAAAAARELVAHRRAAGPHPHGAGELPARPRPLARRGRRHAASAPAGDHPGGERLHRRAAARQRAHRQTRLDNLKELVQSMGAFDTLQAYLEHVALVMDLDRESGEDSVQIMTLHSAKGLEFPLVFLPGWEEGVFPSQRSMDEKGEKGLEEERRLAYVGITRAREEARISFAANRQVYGRWTSQLPSRFVDELPVANVEAASETGYYGGGPGMREAELALGTRPARSARAIDSPGWRRAQERKYRGGPAGVTQVIEGEGRLVAVSEPSAVGDYARGERVFHVKFGYGRSLQIEGNKLTVDFEKAGEKKVIDSFVEKA